MARSTSIWRLRIFVLLMSLKTILQRQTHRCRHKKSRAHNGARPFCLQLIGVTRPRSGCTAHGLREETATGIFVLASSIWLPEGQPVNDLMTKVKLRRNLRRRNSRPRSGRLDLEKQFVVFIGDPDVTERDGGAETRAGELHLPHELAGAGVDAIKRGAGTEPDGTFSGCKRITRADFIGHFRDAVRGRVNVDNA